MKLGPDVGKNTHISEWSDMFSVSVPELALLAGADIKQLTIHAQDGSVYIYLPSGYVYNGTRSFTFAEFLPVLEPADWLSKIQAAGGPASMLVFATWKKIPDGFEKCEDAMIWHKKADNQ